MSRFFGQQTLTAQYFRPNYLHGALKEGKSGYWRLFFTQMQEEALKQYGGHTTDGLVLESTVEKHKKVVPLKKVKLPALVELDTYEVPSFKRKPIYTQETKIDEQLPTVLSNITVGVHPLHTYFSSITALQKVRQKQEKQQVEAANDADMRIRLLLLAA